MRKASPMPFFKGMHCHNLLKKANVIETKETCGIVSKMEGQGFLVDILILFVLRNGTCKH